MDTERTKRSNKAAADLTEAARESYRVVVDRAFVARESNARVTRDFFENTVEELHEQTALNLRTMEELATQMRRQCEALKEISRTSLDSYEEFIGSLESYYEGSAEGAPEDLLESQRR